jgi:pimeloyl-ACP methyl ester carboxylesterase
MRKFLPLLYIYLIVSALIPDFLQAQTVDDIYHKFIKRYHTYQNTILPYHLFIPENYDDQKVYPLVLCLHGIGERGDDSLAVKKNSMAIVWGRDSIQVKWPCFILVPQCPFNYTWESSNMVLAVHDLLDSILVEFTVDTSRICITGLSMGGYGTWAYIAYDPDKYAAAVPVCGGGDPAQASLIKHLSIWAFHGALDNTVPVSGSRNMIAALEKEGVTTVYTDCHNDDCAGLPDSVVAGEINNGARLLYTEYQYGGHSIWDQAYNEPLLMPWVFAQSRTNQPAGISRESLSLSPGRCALYQNYPNPFNPSTNIQFSLFQSEFITLEIYNLLGQKVVILLEGKQEAGTHTVQFNGSGLASGVYFYRLQAGNFYETKKLILLR